MSEKKPFSVDDAYALETPEDSIDLYGKWAATYDEDFVASSGYAVYVQVVDQFIKHREQIGGPILDVGCGTGIVGVGLRDAGIDVVDGIDISPPMLFEARKKRTGDGDTVYRNLIAADVTQHLNIPDNVYTGLTSAGTFTHGHLGPEPLDELWRVAAPGAWCAIGVRTTHYWAAKFDEKFSTGVTRGIISPPNLVEVRMYAPDASNEEHAGDKAFIVLCQVLK